MILQINNTANINNLKYKPKADYISSTNFPEQDSYYIGKKIRIRFKDNSESFVRARLPITNSKYPEYTGESSYDDHFFTIVRWDKEYPYRIIVIDEDQRVLIVDKDWLDLMIYYPGYKNKSDEIIFRQASTWEEYNREYKSDKMYLYPVQNKELLGSLVFSEYYNDIITYDSAVNRMIPDISKQYKTFDQIKQQLLIGNPDLSKMPDCILKSYPHYYDKHKKDKVDIPLRAINSGIVIRSDSEYTVILEILDDKSERYVCSDEGFFYYETESKKVNIKELDIWQRK